MTYSHVVTNMVFLLIYVEPYKIHSLLVSVIILDLCMCVSKFLKIKQINCFFLIIRLLALCLFVCLFVYYLHILVKPYKSYIMNQSDVLNTFVIVYFLIILSLGNTWIIVFLFCCCIACVYLCWGEDRGNLSDIQQGVFLFFFFSVK